MDAIMEKAWCEIDEGLKTLMSVNDTLSDSELRNKSLRLRQLSKFTETLSARINERIRNQRVGPIGPLFDRYIAERMLVDINA